MDEDTELLFNSTYDMDFNFYATYDKSCANVSLSYLTKSSGIQSVNLPQFVDKEATFQDVLNNLKLPEDAYTEDFDGFKLTYSDDFHNENTIVGDIASISVTACYKDCQVAWNTRYMDKVEFETWILPEASLDGTLSGTMTSLDAVAVYKGKTTIDTVCTYRGEDGKITSDNKMILASGEDLSDAAIKGEASEAFKSANHFAGLRLS